MDVKAFIFEATDKSLKIDAAIREVDAAKEAVEAARAAVEAAKAGVEAAKQGVVAAKEELDTYAERAEEFGLTRSKFKDAVERMKTLLTDIGAVKGSAESTETAPVEPKQKAPRKRKGEAVAETATTEQSGEEAPNSESTATNAEASVPAAAESEVADASATAADSTSEKADDAEYLPAMADRILNNPAVMDALAALDTDNTTDGAEAEGEAVVEALEQAPATAAAEIEEIANILRREPHTVAIAENNDEAVVAEVESAIESHTMISTATATAPEDVEDELDNSVAEQELLDFVDEVGTSDNDVKAVLSAAIKVVSWHTTNVAKAPLRTQPSPMTLAGVLAVEDAGYAPKDIQEAYKVALSFGGDKLAAAISWFNKALDLLADAKPVEDFRFAEPAKAARAKKEKPAPAVAQHVEKASVVSPTDAAEAPVNDALDEVIDATDVGSGVSETIEDMQLFSGSEAEEDAQEEVVPEVVKPEEKPAPSFPRVSKPSWLP